VRVNEAALVKEFMDRESRQAAHAENRGKRVRPRAKVRDLAKKLHPVAFLLQGIFRGRVSLNRYAHSLDFKRLLRSLALNQRPVHRNRASDPELRDFGIIIQNAVLKHNLDSLKKAAVVKLQKAERLAVAYRADPTAYAYARIHKPLRLSVYFRNFRPQ
jgi:hypothetical protein